MEFQQEQEQDSKEEEMMDVYSIFIYGIRSQLTCDYYLRRLKRRIHNKMEQLALQQPFNFDIVFGFTDSIFVKVKEGDDYMIKGFIEKCKQELGVIVEIKNVFLKSIVYGKKNRFVGWSGKEEEDIVIKGLDGLADSNPLWLRKWFFKIVNEIIKRPEKRFEAAPKLLQEAVFELENVICKSQSKIEK